MKTKEGAWRKRKRRGWFVHELCGEEEKARGKETRLVYVHTREFKTDMLISFGVGWRRANTFIPFKKTRDRADSSALMKSCPLPLPARRIYGRMRPWGFGASPLRDFRRRVSSLSLPLFFSLIPFAVFVFLGPHPFSLFIPVKNWSFFLPLPPLSLPLLIYFFSSSVSVLLVVVILLKSKKFCIVLCFR